MENNDCDLPLSFSEEKMLHLGNMWNKIYTKFKEDYKELVKEAGGPHMLCLKLGINGATIDIENFVPTFS